MRFPTSSTLVVITLISTTLASYAPVSTSCPRTSLVRLATGLSGSEEAYRVARKAEADIALSAWLLETNPDLKRRSRCLR
jgi:lysophospholipase